MNRSSPEYRRAYYLTRTGQDVDALRRYHTKRRVDILSPRECEVINLSRIGHPGTKIAGLMKVSKQTVNDYRRRICEKLNHADFADVLALAQEGNPT